MTTRTIAQKRALSRYARRALGAGVAGVGAVSVAEVICLTLTVQAVQRLGAYAVVVHDVDNPYRPDETTTIATSQGFESTKPATFGSLVIVPESRHYGESLNIYLGDLKERLEEVGY